MYSVSCRAATRQVKYLTEHLADSYYVQDSTAHGIIFARAGLAIVQRIMIETLHGNIDSNRLKDFAI